MKTVTCHLTVIDCMSSSCFDLLRGDTVCLFSFVHVRDITILSRDGTCAGADGKKKELSDNHNK